MENARSDAGARRSDFLHPGEPRRRPAQGRQGFAQRGDHGAARGGGEGGLLRQAGARAADLRFRRRRQAAPGDGGGEPRSRRRRRDGPRAHRQGLARACGLQRRGAAALHRHGRAEGVHREVARRPERRADRRHHRQFAHLLAGARTGAPARLGSRRRHPDRDRRRDIEHLRRVSHAHGGCRHRLDRARLSDGGARRGPAPGPGLVLGGEIWAARSSLPPAPSSPAIPAPSAASWWAGSMPSASCAPTATRR